MAERPCVSPILQLERLRYGFVDRPDFLGPVDLSVEPGHLWGVIGPNGSGKSTLLRLMVGLRRPTGGVIRLSGRPLADVSARRRARMTAFLPQQPMAQPQPMGQGPMGGMPPNALPPQAVPPAVGAGPPGGPGNVPGMMAMAGQPVGRPPGGGQ